MKISLKENARTKIEDLPKESGRLTNAQAISIIDDIKTKRLELTEVPVDRSDLKKRAARGTGVKSQKKQKLTEGTASTTARETEVDEE